MKVSLADVGEDWSTVRVQMAILDLFYDLMHLDLPSVCDSYEAALKSMSKSLVVERRISDSIICSA